MVRRVAFQPGAIWGHSPDSELLRAANCGCEQLQDVGRS
jgi:hypothetical protein